MGTKCKAIYGTQLRKNIGATRNKFFVQIYEVGGLVIVHVTQEDLTKFGCKSKRKLKILGTLVCLSDMLELIVYI
jgi:hypothetical protein